MSGTATGHKQLTLYDVILVLGSVILFLLQSNKLSVHDGMVALHMSASLNTVVD
jgi:hypothetical protein